MFRRIGVVICVFVLAGASRAANVLKVNDVTASPGDTNVQVRITVDNDEPVWAISFAARYSNKLTFNEITLGAALGPAGVNAEWFEAIEGPGYFGGAVLIDFEEPYEERALPAGTNQEVFVASFDVASDLGCGDELAIDLRSDQGTPAVKPVFTVAPSGSENITETRVPGLVDGVVRIDVDLTVSKIEPDVGNVAGGESITITGTGFSQNTDVTIGGQSLADKTVVNSTTITGKTPAHNVGTVDVVVSNPCGVVTLPDAFEYQVEPPVILDVFPKWDGTAGGAFLTITGRNFSGDTSIFIGGKPLANLTFVNETQITGNAPANDPGPADVEAFKQGAHYTLEDGFNYADSPTLTSVSPNHGLGDVDVTVTGTNFTSVEDPSLVILLGSTTIDISAVTVVSSTELIFHVPPCGSRRGWLPLMLTTAGGAANLTQGYECSEETPEITFRRGDANCDASHDIADAILILGYLFSSKPAQCLDALDTNDSGALDVADAVYLLGYLFANGAPPPPPFPNPGTDPTNDELDCAVQCGAQ